MVNLVHCDCHGLVDIADEEKHYLTLTSGKGRILEYLNNYQKTRQALKNLFFPVYTCVFFFQDFRFLMLISLHIDVILYHSNKENRRVLVIFWIHFLLQQSLSQLYWTKFNIFSHLFRQTWFKTWLNTPLSICHAVLVKPCMVRISWYGNKVFAPFVKFCIRHKSDSSVKTPKTRCQRICNF